MTYDSAGNLTNDTFSGQGQRIYDAENRMTQAQGSPNSQWQTYTYDASGQRVRRNVNGVETWQVYGLGGELLAEYAANAAAASPQKEYGYRNGQLLITAEAAVGSSVNLALNKPATQISTYSTAVAGLAVDGNTNGNYWSGSVTHTVTGTQDWWQVDLGSSCSLQTIKLWNRTDCCGERLSNFYVFVSDQPFTSYDLTTTLNQSGVSNFYAAGQGGTPTAISVNRTARYVRVQLASSGAALSLAEVEVMGSTIPTANINWLVTDQLGTPRMVFDKTGALTNVKRHDYLPFGEELSSGAGLRSSSQGYGATDGIRQKFTSQERDSETGLDYMHARYFASAQGRFTSADTVAGSIGNPQSLNRYAYVGNNPINLTDPTGHMPTYHMYSSYSQDNDGTGWSWDDPTSPQAVLQGAGIVPSQVIDSTQLNDSKHENPAPIAYSGDGIVDTKVGETPADEGYSATDQPLKSVTLLGNKMDINYGGKVSAIDRLVASRRVSAAAGLINVNADRLTDDEKKAIMKIKKFSVVGPGSYIGATSSGMTLEVHRIKNVSIAYLASLFGHEGQHHLNAGKYSGSDLWRDEQSAGRTQLGIGNKLGFTSAESIFLEEYTLDSNRDELQRHMLNPVRSK